MAWDDAPSMKWRPYDFYEGLIAIRRCVSLFEEAEEVFIKPNSF